MKRLFLLVGPSGSGKSTLSYEFVQQGFIRINQDDQGKQGHLDAFNEALEQGLDIVVDRLNFVKGQRDRYLLPAKAKGYITEVMVLHESYDTCLSRCLERKDHPTIKESKDAHRALNMFFSKYERVQDDEADKIHRKWPNNIKPLAVISDLDGTLCNVDHRLHFVKGEGKRDWKSFFQNIGLDSDNRWCKDILTLMHSVGYNIVYCSGRPDDYRKQTQNWLEGRNLPDGNLFMRRRGDFRRDDVVKEILLDFEILTRFTPYVIIDDRKQVVDMWRRRGYTCLACAEGDF